MPSRADEAIVLTRYPYRERDAVVVVLTRLSGQQRLLCRRARGGRSRMAPALESLALVRLSYFERPGSELGTLDEIVMTRSSFALASEPLAWAVAQVLVELTLLHCPEGQQNEPAFRLLKMCVDRLLAGQAPMAVVHYAELWFLRLAGVFPELDRCCVCGLDIPPGAHSYSPVDRGFVCADHRPRGAVVRLTARATGWLVAASRSSLEAIDASAPEEVAGWLVALHEHFTDRRLTTLRFLRHVVSS